MTGILVGAPLALLSQPLGWPWLFWVGLALVGIALLLPVRPGQGARERFDDLVRHLPLFGWLRRGE